MFAAPVLIVRVSASENGSVGAARRMTWGMLQEKPKSWKPHSLNP